MCDCFLFGWYRTLCLGLGLWCEVFWSICLSGICRNAFWIYVLMQLEVIRGFFFVCVAGAFVVALHVGFSGFVVMSFWIFWSRWFWITLWCNAIFFFCVGCRTALFICDYALNLGWLVCSFSPLNKGFLEDEFKTTDKGKNDFGKDHQFPLFPKEEEMSEEELEKMMEERYRPGAGFVTFAEDAYGSKRPMDVDAVIPSSRDPTIWKIKCMV